MRVPRGASVRTSSTLGRYSSAIRAACANERSCGSARGAISNGRPYRDLIFRLLTDAPDATRTESSRNLSEMAWFRQFTSLLGIVKLQRQNRGRKWRLQSLKIGQAWTCRFIFHIVGFANGKRHISRGGL